MILPLLAVINALVALASLVIYFRLARATRSPIRAVYSVACLYYLYTLGIYGYLFLTGQALGVEFTRPATSLLLSVTLAMGIYELYRR